MDKNIVKTQMITLREGKMEEISVLLVEDSRYSADLNIREIKKANVSIRFHKVVANQQSMRNALNEWEWDLIVSDNSMPGFSALGALEVRNSMDKKIPFIIVSEDIFERDLDRAFREGCSAFVPKEELVMLRKIVKEILITHRMEDLF
ncbi:response regulator [Anoxybacterium hadale]|uniref:Response regulator n=1 Tax=Anoxybacterium hadale TaxID=3408580 RepID=A0ACD1AAM4_9FIRM|nr:response regulator [Clostridiales bacterium]